MLWVLKRSLIEIVIAPKTNWLENNHICTKNAYLDIYVRWISPEHQLENFILEIQHLKR